MTVSSDSTHSRTSVSSRQKPITVQRGSAAKKQSKKPLITVGIAVLVLLLAIILIAKGCGASPESDEDIPPLHSEDSMYMSSSSKLPEKWITVRDSSLSKYQIMNLGARSVDVEEFDELEMGAFSGGYAVGNWITSEYDEEWDESYNHEAHVGLFDSSGKMVKDLTAAMHDAGMVQDSAPAAYAENRLIVSGPASTGGHSSRGARRAKTAVFNESGDVVFVCDGTASSSEYKEMYECGILKIKVDSDNSETGMYYRLYDIDGEELFGSPNDFIPIGNGFYAYASSKATEGSECKVYDYDGNTVFDAYSLGMDDLISAKISGRGNGDGLVCVILDRKNPHGGPNRTFAGLYDLKTGEWAVSPSLDFYEKLSKASSLDNSFTYHDGVMPVFLDGSWKFLDDKGNVAFDVATLNGYSSLSATPKITYLNDGFWLFLIEGKKGVVLYFDNGRYVGVMPAMDWMCVSKSSISLVS